MRRCIVGLTALTLIMMGCSADEGTGTTAPPTTVPVTTATTAATTTAPASTSATTTTTTMAPASTSTTAATTTTAPAPPATVDPGASAEMGEQLAARSTCTGCHTVDGSPNDLAPTLLGVAGRTVTFDDGTSLVADADYLRRSIADPAAEIVEGDWLAEMPSTYGFSAAELDSLVLYLQSLTP